MPARVSSPVLIGRVEELARLESGLSEVRSGGSKVALLSGEAGVGKTRLVDELADRARAEGVLVLAGACVPLGEGALPYAPVVAALRGLVRRTDPVQLEPLLGRGRGELARLIPDLGPVAEEAASSLSLGSGQGRLFELLLGVLDRLAERSPVLFIVDDLHWSDQSTRDLLAFLVRNLREARVMLVLTYRSDELHRRHPLLPFLAELGRADRVERFDLRPFDARDSAAQLRAIAGRDLDAALVESIHARSGGNAFFAEELLAAAEENGRTELPQNLRDVLLARVALLADATQEFLRVASAAGQQVDPGLVAAASGISELALYHALRECVARQVLVADASADSERYAFRHALLQEAIYEDLLPGERTRLHSAFARTLEARSAVGQQPAAELAYHWYAAHDLPRALEWSVAAAIADETRYAFPEALTHYERALELWDQVPDAEARARRDQVDLLAAMAGVARFHESNRSVAHIQSAIGLVDSAVNPIRAGLLYERLGRYAWIAAQGRLSQDAYRTAMGLIPADPPSESRARVTAGLAQILMLEARFADSRTLAEEALTIARAVGAREIEGHALNTMGVDRGILGEVERGLSDLEDAQRIAEEAGIVDDIGRACANRCFILEAAGRLAEAVEVAQEGIETSARLGTMRFFGTHLLCEMANYLYQLGRWDESERAVRRAAEIGPFGINAILEQELLGRLAMVRGRLDEAEERLRPLAALAERANDIQFIGPVHASRAELALWQGRADQATAELRAGISLVEFSPEVKIDEMYALGVRASADAAEIARARQSREAETAAVADGDQLLAAIRRRHDELVVTRPVFETASAAWVSLCEAEASRLHRRPDPDLWQSCRRAWEERGRPHVVAYACWREAEARLAARGDRGLAGGALREAARIASTLGFEPLAHEVRALAGRARLELEPARSANGGATPEGTRTVSAEPAEAFGLTAREREVLALVALGRTNRQIASELFISENTAGVHVSNILGKLAVASRGEAAALAYRLGLIDEPAGLGETV